MAGKKRLVSTVTVLKLIRPNELFNMNVHLINKILRASVLKVKKKQNLGAITPDGYAECTS